MNAMLRHSVSLGENHQPYAISLGEDGRIIYLSRSPFLDQLMAGRIRVAVQVTVDKTVVPYRILIDEIGEE